MADVGRPLKFESPEVLEQLIDNYFDSCTNVNGEVIRPYTMSGLALALDTTRRTLLDYVQRNDEYSHSLKRAKSRIENYVEESLFMNKHTAGVIFNLKNNFGWIDKQEVDQTLGNKEGETFKVSDSMKQLTVEELKQLAKSTVDEND